MQQMFYSSVSSVLNSECICPNAQRVNIDRV